MRIIIAGASGYIGKALARELINKQHQVVPVNREVLYGPPEKLRNRISDSDVVVNVAGANILQRWTNKNKRRICESRIRTTANLIKAIEGLPEAKQPGKYISISGINVYRSGLCHTETSTDFDPGFLGNLVKNWESASSGLPAHINRVIFRTGAVLGEKSKPVRYLYIPVKLGLGTIVGSGRQPFPFIHIRDVVKAFIGAIEEPQVSGTYNLVAPQRITHADYVRTMAKCLKRPVFFKIPGFMLRPVFGKASVVITESPEVIPQRLLDEGFEFDYATIKEALWNIWSRRHFE